MPPTRLGLAKARHAASGRTRLSSGWARHSRVIPGMDRGSHHAGTPHTSWLFAHAAAIPDVRPGQRRL